MKPTQVLLISLILAVTVVVVSSQESAREEELAEMENELMVLRNVEGRILQQMEKTLESVYVGAVKSRKRREEKPIVEEDPNQKIRRCGPKIVAAVIRVCSGACHTGTFTSFSKMKRSAEQDNMSMITTKCCGSKCSLNEIKSFCCP